MDKSRDKSNEVRRKEIKKALIDLGIKQKDIANRLGITETAVHNHIYGKYRSRRIEKEIKEILRKNEIASGKALAPAKE